MQYLYLCYSGYKMITNSTYDNCKHSVSLLDHFVIKFMMLDPHQQHYVPSFSSLRHWKPCPHLCHSVSYIAINMCTCEEVHEVVDVKWRSSSRDRHSLAQWLGRPTGTSANRSGGKGRVPLHSISYPPPPTNLFSSCCLCSKHHNFCTHLFLAPFSHLPIFSSLCSCSSSHSNFQA